MSAPADAGLPSPNPPTPPFREQGMTLFGNVKLQEGGEYNKDANFTNWPQARTRGGEKEPPPPPPPALPTFHSCRGGGSGWQPRAAPSPRSATPPPPPPRPPPPPPAPNYDAGDAAALPLPDGRGLDGTDGACCRVPWFAPPFGSPLFSLTPSPSSWHPPVAY